MNYRCPPGGVNCGDWLDRILLIDDVVRSLCSMSDNLSSLLLPLLYSLATARTNECYHCYVDFLTVQMYWICIFVIPDGFLSALSNILPSQDCWATDWLFDLCRRWLAPLLISLKLGRRYGTKACIWFPFKCVCLKGGRVPYKGVWLRGARVIYEQRGWGRQQVSTVYLYSTI